MQKLDHQDYLALRENCKVIEKDGFGDKVMILQDGTFLKLFRRKRLITSAAIWPYAQRFADNAKKLEKLGIPCPKIIQVYRIPSIERDAVHYHPLPGTTLRDLYRGDLEYPADLRERFLKFVEHIQDLGVYFRSIHLGNVVLTPDDELGLIDISDMKIFRRPLSKWQRKRNEEHMVRDAEDAEWLKISASFKHTNAKKELKDFNNLKKTASIISKKNDNNLYLKTLIKYDNSIEDIREIEFVSFLSTHGKGLNTLDSFRKLKKGSEIYFEKTYRTGSSDLKNTLFFYSEIRKKTTNEHIETPAIKKILSGKKITIILFENKPHIKSKNSKEFFDTAMLCVKHLEKIKPKPIKSNIYSLRCYKKSFEFIKDNNLEINSMLEACKIIEKIPSFFAHADISLNNISSNGVVYDWDSSGFYPIGYDLACIICESNIYDTSKIKTIIEHHYKSKENYCSIHEFRISLIFLIFSLVSGKKIQEKKTLYKYLTEYIKLRNL